MQLGVLEHTIKILTNYFTIWDPNCLNDAPKALINILRGQIDQDIDMGLISESMNPNEILIKNCPKVQGFAASVPATHFRGVSRIGKNYWQIIIKNERDDFVYFGTVDNIVKGAIIHDIVSIQTSGLSAKTNFCFTRKEIIALMSLENFMTIKKTIQQRKNAKKL